MNECYSLIVHRLQEPYVRGVVLGSVFHPFQAMSGYGIDRHLLGLKLIALENGKKVPELLQHSSYARMNDLRLSTSQVPSPNLAGLSFGTLVPDGYCILYNPQETRIVLCVSSRNKSAETSSVR